MPLCVHGIPLLWSSEFEKCSIKGFSGKRSPRERLGAALFLIYKWNGEICNAPQYFSFKKRQIPNMRNHAFYLPTLLQGRSYWVTQAQNPNHHWRMERSMYFCNPCIFSTQHFQRLYINGINQ